MAFFIVSSSINLPSLIITHDGKNHVPSATGHHPFERGLPRRGQPIVLIRSHAGIIHGDGISVGAEQMPFAADE
ncbi:hypothetical protein [Martelella alba]|uniref:Uncharacterized protein n=1 Tax=Martelella alba TaxID=2590451 RepID=A0ABY2SHI0_9HYPH|nr:hypothetical protein [Martelella alba]TKI04111.1 hypothetical protein FCN80_19305 [Martelella alba]